MNPKKILFFSISDVSGHKACADAIIAAINSLMPEAICHHLNFFKYLPPSLVNSINSSYYKMIEKKPTLWANLRSNKFIKTLMKIPSFFFCLTLSLKVYFYLLKPEKYSAIVCTQAFPCVCMNILKKIKLIKTPLIAVITDYNINTYWINSCVDYYIFPCDEVKQEFLAHPEAKMIAPSKLKIFGIPIHPKFLKKNDIPFLKKKYSISEKKFVVLIMGGSLGLRGIKEAALALTKIPKETIHLIIATGTNDSLNLELEKIFEESNSPYITLLGYVDNVPELMDIADVLICKPGGLTITEALIKGLSMIFINPIPGQEELNKNLFLKHHAALYVENFDALPDLVQKEMQKTERKHILSDLAKPQSASNVAELIKSLI